MRIILDKSGYGFQLTAAGYSRIIDRKARKNIVIDKDGIDKILDTALFRMDEDLITMVEKYGYGVLLHEYSIKDLPDWIDNINLYDLDLIVEQHEPWGYIERLICEITVA